MQGPLDHLLTHFSLRAGVFYTGNICGLHDFERDERRGHLHLVRSGPVQLIEPGKAAIVIERPTLVFLPRPEIHRLQADEREGADVVCATVLLGGGGRNPISDSLPDTVMIELDQMPGINEILGLMFGEAFDERSGRQTVLDRLCEVLMIRMLRHCLDEGLTMGGALAGLSDPKLAKALTAIHSQPAFDWNLHAMADKAGMSRARFADHFREIMGKHPRTILHPGASCWPSACWPEACPRRPSRLRSVMGHRVRCTGLLSGSWAYRLPTGCASNRKPAAAKHPAISPRRRGNAMRRMANFIHLRFPTMKWR